jgi:membrane associated rhomboid family serine protease
MLPLSDGIPARRFPIVNVLLIVANFAVFIFYELPQLHTAVYHASFYPCTVDNACHGPEPWGLSWITAMFLHGGWDHILGNMLFLAIFGKNVEDAFGSLRYLVFYFAGGFAAMMTQTAITLLFGTAAEARVPELGASGAIAAVLGAYFVLYPGSRVRTWIFPIFLVRIPAWIFLGLWFLYQLIEASFGLFSASANGGGVAFFAHVGGFIFGCWQHGSSPGRDRQHLGSNGAPRRRPRGIFSSPQPAKPDARGGDAHRRRIGYSQSCHKLSAVIAGSLRWMLSNDRQAAAAAGRGPASVAARC